jgi:hypothetical protein
MPFQSEKQRRFLWAAHPDIAKRWAHEYPESNKNLPLYAHDHDASKGDSAKTAAVDALRFAANKWANITNLVNINTLSAGETKAANSGMVRVPVPNSEKPTYAGQEQEEGTAKPVEKTDCGPTDIRNSQNPKEQDENAVSALFGKLSAVLARPLREALEVEQALQEARNPLFVPENLGLRQFSAPSPVIAPPMGMAAAPGQPQPQAPAQPAQPGQAAPVGGGSNPQFNPINAFGAIGAKGQLNGNAAFGQKNSPDSSKIANLQNYTLPQYPYDPQLHTMLQKWESAGGDSRTAQIPAHLVEPLSKYMRGLNMTHAQSGQPVPLLPEGQNPDELDAVETLMELERAQPKQKLAASSPAWQRSEGKNDAGGLNEKGRKSYEREHGGNLKAPVTESNPSGERAKRQNSFCSRMCGMKSENTGADTAKDPDSRINKSLRKWNCKCSSAYEFGEKIAAANANLDPNLNMVYNKPKTNYMMPKYLRENQLAPEQASQLLAGMRAVAPHNALDKTRLDWNGLQIQGYGSRVHDNDRVTRLGRWLHQFDGDQFEAAHPDKTQGFGDAFFPYANLVSVPSGMGGTAMHELGHAIDFNAFPADSSLRHLGAALYRAHAPTLWKEHAAWRKGRKGVLDAYTADKLDPQIAYKVLESGKGAKRVGLGSYWGAGLGTAGGIGAALAGMAALNEMGVDLRNIPGRVLTLPVIGGAMLGGMGGIGLGNLLAKEPPKREKIVKLMAQHLAKKQRLPYAQAQQLVEQQLAQSAPAQPVLRKAAEALTEKISMPRGLGELPQGAGPDQIADAVMRFNQLRTLVRPTDETLKAQGLSRPGFQNSLRKITAHSQGKDKFDLQSVAPNPKLRAALAGLAGLGAAGGLAYTGNTDMAVGALPVTALAAGGAYLHGQHERDNVLNTAKLMKQYGLLKPKLLQQAYPLLGEDYRVA